MNNALEVMRREYRRYFRYPAGLSLFVGLEKQGFQSGRLLNVSEEGMAILLTAPSKSEGSVTLRFDLPSIEPYAIEARGEIAWGDSEGRLGIKLRHMQDEARRKYREWLNVLHSQLEFRKLSGKIKS